MRITVDIDEKLVRDAMELWGFDGRKTKRALVNQALREYVEAFRTGRLSRRISSLGYPSATDEESD